VIGHQRLDAERLALLLHQRDLGIGVGREAVDRDHGRQAEFLDVLDVALQVAMPLRAPSRSSFFRSSFFTPPCILSARMVATTTTQSGFSRPCGT
jgi:hypothetical protein